jgi:hypothetical protein
MTYVTEIYCENTDCNARQSTVFTKDYGDNPEPTVWRCPACGKQAKVHWKISLRAYEERQLAFAIGRVNEALYVREASRDLKVGDLIAVRASIGALQELPDSWKCVDKCVK